MFVVRIRQLISSVTFFDARRRSSLATARRTRPINVVLTGSNGVWPTALKHTHKCIIMDIVTVSVSNCRNNICEVQYGPCCQIFLAPPLVVTTRSIWKMLGPFATTSRLTPIHQVSPLYCRTPPAHRCPQRQRRRRQRVTEGTAMAPWNGPNHPAHHHR